MKKVHVLDIVDDGHVDDKILNNQLLNKYLSGVNWPQTGAHAAISR